MGADEVVPITPVRLGVNGWRLTSARTGVARYIWNVVRYWTPELVRGRFDEIRFYTPRPLDRREVPLPESVRERVLASTAPMLVWENLWFGPRASDDVLFCPSFSRPVIARGRTVVTIFEATLKLYPEYAPRTSRFTIPRLYLELYEWSGRHADLVLCATEAAKRDLVAAYGIPAEKIRVIPLAAPDEFHEPASPEELARIRREYALGDDPFFLYVGKMTPRRNVPFLIEAFAELKRHSRLPHRLVVVGLDTVHIDPPSIARRLGISDSFLYREYVSDADLRPLYAGAQAFVLPYTYEALSLPTLEAQVAGTPVVTVDAPGLVEVTGGKALLLPSPEPSAIRDALLRVATDEGLRRRLSTDGREFASAFTWRRTSEETLAALAEAGGRG